MGRSIKYDPETNGAKSVAFAAQAGRGRPKGVPNKATACIKALAQLHGADMMLEAIRIATTSEQDTARISAAALVLGYGYGKPTQTIAGDAKAPLRLILAPSDLGLLTNNAGPLSHSS